MNNVHCRLSELENLKRVLWTPIERGFISFRKINKNNQTYKLNKPLSFILSRMYLLRKFVAPIK